MVYEFLNEKIEPSSIIPKFCTSFAEQAMYVAEAAEEAYNEMFKEIGIDELAVYESTGCMVVYEGAKLDAFKEKITKILTTIWSNIKEAYAKFLKYLDDRRKESIEKGYNKVTAENLKGDKVIAKVHNFKGIEADFGKFASNARGLSDKVLNQISVNGDLSNLDGMKEEFSGKNIFTTVSGVEAESAKDIKAKLKAIFMGDEVEVTATLLSSKIDDVKNVLLAGKAKAVIKQAYNAEKKNLDDVLKKVKGLKADDNFVSAGAVLVGAIKDITVALHTCMAVLMDAEAKRYSECKNLLMKAITLSGKKAPEEEKKEEPKVETPNESFNFEAQTTQKDLVESVFNW